MMLEIFSLWACRGSFNSEANFLVIREMDAPESRRARARRSQESCLTQAIAVDRSAAGGVFRCNTAVFSESDAVEI